MPGVKFFTTSVMGLDRMEREINEFCKDKEVVNVMMQECSQLIVVMVFYR